MKNWGCRSSEIPRKVWGLSLRTAPILFQMKFQSYPGLLPQSYQALSCLRTFVLTVFFSEGLSEPLNWRFSPFFILFHSYLSYSFIALTATWNYFVTLLFTFALLITLEGELHEELVSVLLIPHPQHLAHCLVHDKWLTAVNWMRTKMGGGAEEPQELKRSGPKAKWRCHFLEEGFTEILESSCLTASVHKRGNQAP